MPRTPMIARVTQTVGELTSKNDHIQKDTDSAVLPYSPVLSGQNEEYLVKQPWS
jgi:hypothetical protein